MVKWRPHIVFVLLMMFYLIVRFLRVKHPELPSFFKFQITDLIFVPAMCCFALIFIRFFKRDSSLLIPWYSVLIQVLIVSVLFEWYLPKFGYADNIYTSDILDVIMYFLGGGIFILLQRFFFASK